MKIAISGAHGVGKTTLAKALAKELGLPLIEEVARGVAKKCGFKNTEQIRDADKTVKMFFQQNVFVEQQLAEAECFTGFISDRSIFDPLAYCMYYDIDHEVFRNNAIEWSENYDFIVYCPIPDGGISDDGFRLTDEESQWFIGAALRWLLLSSKCSVLWLGKDRSKWESDVLEYIRMNFRMEMLALRGRGNER